MIHQLYPHSTPYQPAEPQPIITEAVLLPSIRHGNLAESLICATMGLQSLLIKGGIDSYVVQEQNQKPDESLLDPIDRLINVGLHVSSLIIVSSNSALPPADHVNLYNSLYHSNRLRDTFPGGVHRAMFNNLDTSAGHSYSPASSVSSSNVSLIQYGAFSLDDILKKVLAAY